MPTVAENIINLDARRRPTVRVIRTVQPGRPNHIKYRLYGSRSQDVQDYIASLTEEVEQPGIGFTRFNGPHYIGHGCYTANGEIVLITEAP
jgi:hypothetical protein